ncbi:sigma-70 family RNA polymerase sigma factor [Oceanobacillus bengalensis]|uniref:sigma-70 family RNA polymerase sigma factor n=1 Tax=Oceanobacillus bengalensis TaxID=1435466 RepID=UPI0015FEE710|nr:sigma-70 family RNA polymerase sigma factor [Oceanobacillus bengalensis]
MDIQELYKLYINDVYRYLLSHCKDKSLAEDLTQDTFMKAYLSLDKSPPNALKAWLFKIAYHSFIDYIRRNKRLDISEPAFFTNIAQSVSVEAEFLQNEDKNELYNNLDRLKAVQKQAIMLCDIEGYSYKEAASILSIKENTLKSHIFRGRGKLRQLYNKGSVER